VTTSFYESHLAEPHHRLLGHSVVQSYLTGTGIRFDGAELSAVLASSLDPVEQRLVRHAQRPCRRRDDLPARH